jgi:hypothetical protein
MLDEYRKADGIQDRDERVRRKDDLALMLGYFSLGRCISRAALAFSGDEGSLVALSIMIREHPKRSDALLLAAAGRIEMPVHAHYRVFEAIHSLAKADLIERSHIQPLRDLLTGYRAKLEPEHHGGIGAAPQALRDTQPN